MNVKPKGKRYKTLPCRKKLPRKGKQQQKLGSLLVEVICAVWLFVYVKIVIVETDETVEF